MRMQIYESKLNEQPVRKRRVRVVSLIWISRCPTFCGAIKSPVPAEVEADAPASAPRILGGSIVPIWLVHMWLVLAITMYISIPDICNRNFSKLSFLPSARRLVTPGSLIVRHTFNRRKILFSDVLLKWRLRKLILASSRMSSSWPWISTLRSQPKTYRLPSPCSNGLSGMCR